MKNLFYLFAALIGLSLTFSSCSDDDDVADKEFDNWEARNAAYFQSIRSEALGDIAKAKKLYGDEWLSHTNWRTYLSYSLSEAAQTNTSTDSIYVKIINHGTGSGSPLGTDSVRIFYAGRLMPSANYAEGKMFDHSGQSSIINKIFDHTTSVPSTFKVTDCVKGFATALQYMRIGDRWRIYVPQQLGYKKTITKDVPAFSTLVFEVELVQYARAGSRLPIWN